MRKRIVAGNWKMNLDHRQGAGLARGVASGIEGKAPGAEVIVFPPFTAIQSVVEALEGTEVRTGAQDLWYEDSGAFTGEISASMLLALGCTHVLVGHSERRHVIGEGTKLLARKLEAALEAGLTPVYCVGELLEEREAGKAEEVVAGQLGGVLESLSGDRMSSVVIAYEPVWAIGTGRTATPGDASAMHGFIRGWVGEAFGPGTADDATILYGGSVKPDNAATLLSSDDIDGALVGGAALEAASFLEIVFAAST